MNARTEISRTVTTTCPYCGVGCGVQATVTAAGAVEIAGDASHPANFGRLCSKGSALGETLALDGRLLYPMLHANRVRWDEALDEVAGRFQAVITAHGPDAVAFYVSGQLLTEDYYVANKLMKGFIGSANIDTNSRLCMASSVAGHTRAFGEDVVPGVYADLEAADLVVLVGSNLAWCHPILYQRLAVARETRGTKVVVVDPRRTLTCDSADMHLAVAPDGDVALFNGLLAYLAAHGCVDEAYVAAHTSGIDAALQAAGPWDAASVADRAGLTVAEVEAFCALFAATPRVVTAFSQGVNQSACGTDKVNAIINCHLATGRIGMAGTGPFSVTGQPNAMGGREAGGMATMLAAHMQLGDANHRRIVGEFWGAPRVAAKPGLKAVDLFRAVGDGRIKALWIMATNPADSMPEADAVKAALAACPFVVVSDVVRHTDTTAFAHVLLPSTAWGEKDGTVTNSERRISRQRAFLAPPGEARPDWWQMAEVGKRLGFKDAFTYDGAFEIFAEHARLSGASNRGTRVFDIGAAGAMTAAAYDGLQPFQWPWAKGEPRGELSTERRLFAAGGFATPDGRARFVATPAAGDALGHGAQPESQGSRGLVPWPSSHPLTLDTFTLNTGRIRDQWHTMTRTGKAARLMRHIAEPFAEIHSADARRAGIAPAALVRVSNDLGSVVVRALVSDRQREGSVFVPMHWTDQLASCARVDALVAGNVDPVSGQPALKGGRCEIARYPARWHGFAMTIRRPERIAADYWALAPADGGWRVELAGVSEPADWGSYARELLGLDSAGEGIGQRAVGGGSDAESAGEVEIVAFTDGAARGHRFAAIRDGRLVGALYVASTPVEVARGFMLGRLGQVIAPADRLRLLVGRAGSDEPDKGAIVCSCYEIGRNEILAAMAAGAGSVAAIGERLRAGTNCGSCRPEIGGLLAAAKGG